MNNVTLVLDIEITFRAFGVTFAHIKDQLKEPLPPVAVALAKFAGNVVVMRYNQHGVNLLISLQHDASQPPQQLP